MRKKATDQRFLRLIASHEAPVTVGITTATLERKLRLGHGPVWTRLDKLRKAGLIQKAFEGWLITAKGKVEMQRG